MPIITQVKALAHKVQAPYKVIAQGLLTPAAVRRGAMTCFGLAGLLGVYLVSRTSWPLALVCLASVGVAYGYSAGPLPLGHIGLGEPLVFVFMGPVMVLGSFYVQVQAVLGRGMAVRAGRMSGHRYPRGQQSP